MPDFSDPNFDFEEAQRVLDRKRKYIAATLARPAAESGYKGKYYVPPYEQLTKAIIDAAGQYEQRGLDTQGTELANAKNAQIAQLLSEMPEEIPAQPGQPAVVGTGPIAPPPGTPGVEPFEPPDPIMQQGMPPPMDTPAVWDDGKTMDMVPKGVTGENYLPNKAEVPPTPLIPTTLGDMTKWAGKFSRFGDVGDVAKEAIKFGIQQPERKALAREMAAERAAKASAELAARIEADVRRHEDRLADNKREQQYNEDRIKSGTLSREETARHHKEVERLQDEANKIRADATKAAAEAKKERDAEKISEKSKLVIKHTHDYAVLMNKEKLEPLDKLLAGVEKELAQYEVAPLPGDTSGEKKYKGIPGVGVGENVFAEAFLDKKGVAMHRAIIPLQRMITAAEAGLSQTASEMKGVLDNLARSGMSPEEAFPIAIQKLREIVNLRRTVISSGFEPEAVDVYHKRSGTPNPQAGREETAVRVKSEAEWRALPKGTLFIPEDGSPARRK